MDGSLVEAAEELVTKLVETQQRTVDMVEVQHQQGELSGVVLEMVSLLQEHHR